MMSCVPCGALCFEINNCGKIFTAVNKITKRSITMNNQDFEKKEYDSVSEIAVSTDCSGKYDLKKIFSGPLFLTLCIMISVLTCVELAFSTVNVLMVLLTIGMWISYSKAKDGEKLGTGAVMVSGTLKAMKILLWISTGIFFFAGIVAVLLSDWFVSDAEDIIDAYLPEIMISLETMGITDIDIESEISELFGSLEAMGLSGFELISIVVTAVGIVIAAIALVMVLINVFYFRKLHLCAKSICEYEKGNTEEILCVNAVGNWLMVFGVLSAVNAVFSLELFITGALTSALYILASVFVKKNFK